MEIEDRESSGPVVGGSSLLIIFTVLALVVFSLLALATARADARLQEAGQESVEGYYDADAVCQGIFASLIKGEPVEGVEESALADGGTVYSWSEPATDTQTLFCEVEKMSDGTWQVLRWQSDSETEVNLDQKINVVQLG